MPVEHHDEQLLRDLNAFGQTLEAHTGEILRPLDSEPWPAPDPLDYHVEGQAGSAAGSHSGSKWLRRWPTAVAVTAAAMLVVVASIAFTRLRTENDVTTASSLDDPKELAIFASRGPSQIIGADGENIASIIYLEAEGEAAIEFSAGGVEEGKDNVAYAEQVLRELRSNDVLWSAVDLTNANKEQWMGQAGLQLQTNFDPDIQKSAATASRQAEVDLDGVDTQVITVDSSTGAVFAFYGVGFDEEEERRPVLRQPGSAMLPIVAAEAYEQGYNYLDEVSGDSPCAFALPSSDSDDPYLVNGPSYGQLSIQDVVAESSNCGAVRLGYALGAEKIAAQAQNLGITAPIDGVPSLPLGPFEVEPIDLVGVYTVFANGGQHIKPWYVSEVSVDGGDRLFTRSGGVSQVVSEDTAAMMNQTLLHSTENGTGRFEAQMEGRPSAGKTGTTQSIRDAWYVGYTPQYTTGVWVGLVPGAPEPTTVAGAALVGGRQPAALWHDHMTTIHDGLEVKAFPPVVEPPGSPQTIEVAEEVPVPADR